MSSSCTSDTCAGPLSAISTSIIGGAFTGPWRWMRPTIVPSDCLSAGMWWNSPMSAVFNDTTSGARRDQAWVRCDPGANRETRSQIKLVGI